MSVQRYLRRYWTMNSKPLSSWTLRSSLALAVSLVLFSAPSLYAQVDAGAILGTVTDASGATVKGATVTLTNEGTAATLSTTTGDDGGYKFPPVRIGSYTVSVTHQRLPPTDHKNPTHTPAPPLMPHSPLKP